MMKNENGITLVILVITILVLLILAGASLNMTFTEIDNVRNDRLKAELGIVRQAIVEQYQKADALGKTGKSKDDEQLDIWVGTKITNKEDNSNERKIEFPEALIATLRQNGIANSYIFTYVDEYDSCEKQEDFYYRLSKEDLQTLGIDKSEHEYIVNYKTGEVYNETKKVTYNNELLYLTPVNYVEPAEINDEENFNDWTDEDGNDMIEVRQYEKNN